MDVLTGPMILLAQRSRAEHFSDAFRSRPNASDQSEILMGLLILAGITASIWLLSRWLSVKERHRAYNSPMRLFFALCRAHRLKWSDRWLLWRLARLQRLKDPARLFLESHRFDETKLPAVLRPRAARLKKLHGRLFGELPKENLEKEGKPRRDRHPRPEKSKTRRTARPATPLPPVASAPTLDIPPWSSLGSASQPGT